MDLPLGKQLKKRLHLEIAILQDEVTEVVYSIAKPVLHGGTAVWRCYNGNRFSEDLDFYIARNKEFGESLKTKLDERSLTLAKYKETDNLIFAKIINNGVEVRFEANFARLPTSVVKPFERVDGTFIDVLTLSPDDLLLEKIETYQNRKFIRDIYDVYHLAKFIKKEETRKAIDNFVQKIAPPIDEKNLKVLIYNGLCPSFDQMVVGLGGLL